MSLVFAGVCSHAPGITGRAHMADPDVRDRFYDAFRQMGDDLRAAKPDAVVIIAAEHFANFFMNNMPSFNTKPTRVFDGALIRIGHTLSLIHI